MKLLILKAVTNSAHQRAHKYNVIGRAGGGDRYSWGDLERLVGEAFDDETRRLAARAFESLVSDGLLVCTHQDMVSPESWFTISDAGRRALERVAFDALDEVLLRIRPHFPEMHEGMHVAVRSGTPDAARQAAHSARELLTQVLNAEAPDEEVMCQSWFVPNPESRTGVTRKDRARFVMTKHHRHPGEADVTAADALLQFIDATYHRLSGRAHQPHVQPSQNDVLGLIADTERALTMLLVPNE
jgi:hypothetical protein